MPKLRLPLDDADLANLRESGLTDATIRANKLHTENDALVFPCRDLDGNVNGFFRWRPHDPPIIGDKPAKYLQPKGSPVKAYFPAASVCKLRDGSSAVMFTEGEKKALRLSQEGYTTIGLGGVYSWKKKGTDDLIDDLAAIDWKGCEVSVVFDYDEKPDTRRQVDDARRRFAKALRGVGAKDVFDVKIPPGPNGGKQGVDDFLVAHGAEAFLVLVAKAEPVPTQEPTSVAKPEGRTDSANAARLIHQFGELNRGGWHTGVLLFTYTNFTFIDGAHQTHRKGPWKTRATVEGTDTLSSVNHLKIGILCYPSPCPTPQTGRNRPTNDRPVR